jgi:hypothetical protein
VGPERDANIYGSNAGKIPTTLTSRTGAPRRRLHHEFLDALRGKGQAPNSAQTYEKTIEPWLRWLDGSWEPEGPKRQRR